MKRTVAIVGPRNKEKVASIMKMLNINSDPNIPIGNHIEPYLAFHRNTLYVLEDVPMELEKSSTRSNPNLIVYTVEKDNCIFVPPNELTLEKIHSLCDSS